MTQTQTRTVHFRASFTAFTPCRIPVWSGDDGHLTRIDRTQHRRNVTCPECLAALAEADARVSDPEARGR